LDIVKVNKENLTIILHLIQAYEAEFSLITKKVPQKNGLFLMDTTIDEEHPSFLLYKNKFPVGFCIKSTHDRRHDIAEFYVVPSMRAQELGTSFAIEIFKYYPGSWQVRQIEGADKARAFWRKAIGKFTNNNFTESVVEDHYWGKVTRQLFES